MESTVDFTPRRSMLFMPGDSLRKISKAAQLDVDCIVMDLEDGVAFSQKEAARQTVGEAFQTLEFGRSERLVRLNPPESDLFAADIETTITVQPDGYVIPKVETAEHLAVVDRYLAQAEAERGWANGGIKLFAVVETAKGIVNLKEIAEATPRLAALMFGAEDLAGDIGATRTKAGWEVFYARSAVVIVAAAFDIQAIDMVFTDLSDEDGLAEECRIAQQLGYDGKMAIHPRQVGVIHRAFAPSPEAVERAQRLIAAHQQHQAAGAGAFNFEGKMVDMPLVRAAENTLVQARLAGMLDQ